MRHRCSPEQPKLILLDLLNVEGNKSFRDVVYRLAELERKDVAREEKSEFAEDPAL